MIQKINFNDCVAIRGMGRVDETRPIDLQEYVIPKISIALKKFLMVFIKKLKLFFIA